MKGIRLADVLEKPGVAASVYEFVSSTQFNGKFFHLADGKKHVGVSLHAICGLRLATLGFTPSTPKVDLNGRQTSDVDDNPS